MLFVLVLLRLLGIVAAIYLAICLKAWLDAGMWWTSPLAMVLILYAAYLLETPQQRSEHRASLKAWWKRRLGRRPE